MGYVARHWFPIVSLLLSGFALFNSREAIKVQKKQFTLINQAYLELDRELLHEGPIFKGYTKNLDITRLDSLRLNAVSLQINVRNVGNVPAYYDIKKLTMSYNGTELTTKAPFKDIVYPGRMSMLHDLRHFFSSDRTVFLPYDTIQKAKINGEILIEYWDLDSKHIKVLHRRFHVNLGRGISSFSDTMTGDSI